MTVFIPLLFPDRSEFRNNFWAEAFDLRRFLLFLRSRHFIDDFQVQLMTLLHRSNGFYVRRNGKNAEGGHLKFHLKVSFLKVLDNFK